MSDARIKKALISVYHKEGIDDLIKCLVEHNVELVSTGGTQEYITRLGYECTAVEDLTSYPSILGGRVKTLHPAIFGGILARRNNDEDERQCKMYDIHPIDLVVVDLYPFEETVRDGGTEAEVIEKIDIGGISLIRAAAKNYKDVTIISSRDHYGEIVDLLNAQKGCTTLEQRRNFAERAFRCTSRYDSHIMNYFMGEKEIEGTITLGPSLPLRYGENQHQAGTYYGRAFKDRFEYLHGKQLSYNNILDVDAATHLIEELEGPAVAIMKHNTPCGLAVRDNIRDAYLAALECDPVSAYGGIVVLNQEVDEATAEELHKLFIEVLIAPGYSREALTLLSQKKNRIILRDKTGVDTTQLSYRSALGGMLEQERDRRIETEEDFTYATDKRPTQKEVKDLLFGMKAVKYCKSNAIVLARGQQILGAGYGQTSRVDALKQAIQKAKDMGFELKGAVMASDAFFPFNDCVKIAHEEGISAVIQPGGSVRDQDSIDYCNENGLAMVMTGVRHFRH